MELNEKQIEIAAGAICMREDEIDRYELNQQTYEEICARMTKEPWPKHLERFRRVRIEEIPAEMPDEDVDKIMELQSRDWFKVLSRTERREKMKCQIAIEALLSKIPEDRQEKALSAARARRDAPVE